MAPEHGCWCDGSCIHDEEIYADVGSARAMLAVAKENRRGEAVSLEAALSMSGWLWLGANDIARLFCDRHYWPLLQRLPEPAFYRLARAYELNSLCNHECGERGAVIYVPAPPDRLSRVLRT